MDEEIVFGSELKLRGNDIAEGHLVLFGDKNTTDKSRKRDFFTPETDFGLDLGTKTRVLYQHGMDVKFGKMTLAIGELKMDDMGVWVEAQLKLRDEYMTAIQSLSEKKALGWSSGTASHLVEREKQDNGAHFIKTWHLGLDASLTPNPAEPRTVASIKSLFLNVKSEGLSDSDKRKMIQTALRARFAPMSTDIYLYITDMYDKSVVFEREDDGSFEVSYELTDTGVTLGEPVRVVRVSQYKPVEAVKTERELEKMLRDVAGFSSREAKTIIADGFRAIRSSRDAGDEETKTAALDAAKSAYLATERKFATVLA